MRVQCSICTDLFEDEGSISALQCGHTFHEHCINQWLNSANTCPSCRVHVDKKKIIKRLFFDKGDDQGVDESKLSNENNSLKVKLREKEAEKETIQEEKQGLEVKIVNLKEDKKELELKIKQDQSTISTMKKQLQFHQAQAKSLELERKECKEARKKMIEMKNIETLLTGCETDTQELLDRHGHGEGSVKELAKYCAIIKGEYEQLKSKFKAMKSDFDRHKKDYIIKDTQLKDGKKEISLLKDIAKKSDEDLQKAEKHIEHLRKKTSKLQNILRSPSANGNNSFIETVIGDSPKVSTPVLSSQSLNVVDDTPTKLIPDIAKPSPNTQLRQQCQENNVKVMKITSASSHPPAKRQKCDDVNSFAGFNIFKKTSGMGDGKSAIRTGYDGLGGHTTFTQRQSRPKLTMKKSVSRTGIMKSGKAVGVPKLPSMDKFVVID